MRKINPYKLTHMNQAELNKARSAIKTSLNYMTEPELRTYLRVGSKTANQRLREIEKQGLTKSSQAYQGVMLALHDGSKEVALTQGKAKFITNFRKMDRNALLHQATYVANFLGLKTSTVRGIREVTPKGYQTFKKNFEADYGIKAPTEDEMNDFWRSKLVQNFQKIYGSQETVRMLNKVSSPDTLMKVFEANKKEIEYMARLKSVGTRKNPGANSQFFDKTINDIWNNLESGF